MKLKINVTYLLLLLLPVALGGLGGCAGNHTFTTAARGGETVALPLGYRNNPQHKNLTVTITDSAAQTITYQPNDPKVRGIFNLYPDPASKAVVGFRTNQEFGVQAKTLGGLIQGNLYPGATGTSGDSDWWMTTLMLDLPTTMSNGQPIAVGPATIGLSDSAGGTAYRNIAVEILSGSSTPNSFTFFATAGGSAVSYSNTLNILERADNYVVTFTAPTIPHSLQLDFTRTAAIGVPYVVNPRGDIKNVMWTDNGTALRIMVAPTAGVTLTSAKDLKFYIAGGIAGLSVPTVKAYDINGSLITGVTATVKDSTQ